MAGIILVVQDVAVNETTSCSHGIQRLMATRICLKWADFLTLVDETLVRFLLSESLTLFNYLAKKHVNQVTETGFDSVLYLALEENCKVCTIRDYKEAYHISIGTIGMSNRLGLFRLL